MSQSALMSIERLLAVNRRSPEYNETSRASVFYAQSWLLTHFLLCGKDRSNAERLEKYLARTENDTANATAAFTEIFGKTPGEMELALRGYLGGGLFYQRRMTLQPIDESKITFRPATPVESEATLLSLRWRLRRSPEDVPPLHTLAAREPTAPEPQEALAAIASAQGERESALDHWRLAADHQSTNAYVYLQLARHRLREFHASEFDARLAPEEAAQVQGWLDRALALRPNYPEAIAALAVAESRAPQLRAAGILAIQKGLPLQREQRPATLLSYAMICWRARELPVCLKILDSLIASARTPAAVRTSAEQLRLKVTGKLSPEGFIPKEP
ncbi:MAG: hypothetical protein NTV51_16575, partial [Verrucomicrobia bacterium]|nr:hypothetical protein [Verrucomicrobiota bacterium]